MKRLLFVLCFIFYIGLSYSNPINLLTPILIADATDNVQLYLDFEDRYTDQSGIDRTVIPNGTATYIDGRVGRSILFDELSGLLVSATPEGIDGSGALSWAGWFKRPDTTTPIVGAFLKPETYYINIDEADGGEYGGIIIDASGGPIVYTSTGEIAETTDWVHVALVVDLVGDASTVTFYINGEIEQTLSSDLYADSIKGNMLLLALGNYPVYMDELKIYNKSLNPTEVFILAEGATPTVTPTPTGTLPTPTKTGTPTPTKTATITNTPTITNTFPHIKRFLPTNVPIINLRSTPTPRPFGRNLWNRKPLN